MATSEPNIESNACRARDARERRGRIGIGRRILRLAAGNPIPHAGRISFRVTILATFLLASCGYNTRSFIIESAILTPDNFECNAADYEGLVERHLSALGRPVASRDRILGTLSKMAVKIWRMDSKPEETCRVRFDIVNPEPPRIPFVYTIRYAIVTFIVEDDDVCLNRNDDNYGEEYWVRSEKWRRSQGTSILRGETGHPWRRIRGENAYSPVNWSTPNWKAPAYVYEYLPVCFGRDGKIVGYLDG